MWCAEFNFIVLYLPRSSAGQTLGNGKEFEFERAIDLGALQILLF
jgi:hypothetical protein